MRQRTLIRHVRPTGRGDQVRFEVLHVSPWNPRWWLEWSRRWAMIGWWNLGRWWDRLDRM